ncbi:hypothetical protein BDV26DRAFT_274235 [Aspergillus bertholletiae]|uniref:Uncharacterized protein n=1 Tax=Aspergillus bertholletiae TaxID=1226010 RepID=A0A5N7AUB2_9EURO|nr:hypothetical protein BDV26DRAFT_274235 [Aspergillus bertholletiae]
MAIAIAISLFHALPTSRFPRPQPRRCVTVDTISITPTSENITNPVGKATKHIYRAKFNRMSWGSGAFMVHPGNHIRYHSVKIQYHSTGSKAKRVRC